MVNTPIPHSLKSEAKKAAKILRDFTMPNAKAGPDKLIPAGILAKAKGLAIITVFKAGFLVTARGGSGIVIAKLDDDNWDYGSGWSAPSAIGLAGLGGGFEIGMEVTDFVIILNTRSAVDAFSKGGNLTLGGNFTIAAGPLGRNIEGDIAVRSAAAIYTYSKTKGIFAGISVEGSALIERKDANRKFYGKSIRAVQILQGDVSIPEDCQSLYKVLEEHRELAAKAALKMGKAKALKAKDKLQNEAEREASYKYGVSFDQWRTRSSNSSSKSSAKSSSKSSTKSSKPSTKSSKLSESKVSKSKSEWYLPHSSSSALSGSASAAAISSGIQDRNMLSSSSFTRRPRSNSQGFERPSSVARYDYDSDDDDDVEPHDEADSLWVVADFPFKGQLPCDLSFEAGEKILVTTRTNQRNDWWEGVNERGRQGIFPANYFHIL